MQALDRLLQLLRIKPEPSSEEEKSEPKRETTMRQPNVERAVPPKPQHRSEE